MMKLEEVAEHLSTLEGVHQREHGGLQQGLAAGELHEVPTDDGRRLTTLAP